MTDLKSIEELKDLKFTEKFIPVGDLVMDRRVQRDGLNVNKVEKMYREWLEAAIGVITVSLRADRSYVILDGQHRVEVKRRNTDNTGEVLCHVFEGLTLSQEALMFLALNTTSQPSLLEKFKVRLSAEDPIAKDIDALTKAYEWKVSGVPGNSNINAVGALERLYTLSVKKEMEPNLVHLVIMTATRSWGHDRDGVQAAMLDGLGMVFAHYGDRLNVDVLIHALKAFKGGPRGLHADAVTYAKLRKGTVANAVAELTVNAYNKGRRTSSLPEWPRRG